MLWRMMLMAIGYLLALSQEIPALSVETTQTTYRCDPTISLEIWEKLSPYFLPENHPVKQKLDLLFFSEDVLSSVYTVSQAGFKAPKPQPYSGIIATKHPDVKGYFFKFYTKEKNLRLWKRLLWRVMGAKKIANAIRQRQVEHLFKVPKKWVYPIPGPNGSKNFMIVAQDMRLVKKEKNISFWKSSAMTKQRLSALYDIAKELGLNDSLTPRNTYLSKDYKLAFIDTEMFDSRNLNWKRSLSYLNPKMQRYWKKLTKLTKSQKKNS